MDFLTTGARETQKIGRNLAKEIIQSKVKKTAMVLGLEGDLGGGKTTFLQGFARGLGIKEKILSPTFIIMHKYKIPNAKYAIKNFYHFDCYRIKKAKEVSLLGFKEIISNPKNVVALEWADRIKKIIPRENLWINFQFIDSNKRKIIIKY